MKELALLLLACVLLQNCHAQVNSVTADGFDTIHLDDPSWLTTIHHSYYLRDLFIYGSGVTRKVDDQSFQALLPLSGAGWSYPFIDIDYFYDQANSTWAVGPVGSTPGIGPQPSGLEVRVAITGGAYGFSQIVCLGGIGSGYLPVSVRVDASQLPTVTAYFLGYLPSATPAGAAWGIMRTTTLLNAQNPNPITVLTMNTTNNYDIGVLNSFPFNMQENVQDFIFHDPLTGYLYIVDNYADLVHIYQLPFANQTMSGGTVTTFPVSSWTYGYIITSAEYSPTFHNLYIGLAANGQGTGAVLVISVSNTNLSYQNMFTLPANFSNPKSLIIDPFNGTMYVGMNGGSAILKYNLNTFALIGYQNLPEYLHRLWAGRDGGEHVYYITNEQHSKVFRVNKNDFCPAQCPYFGYCQAGKCVCSSYFEMLNGQCQPKTYVQERILERKVHGGETALGILFMFAVIAAAAGWFMFWRQKRGGASYQPVL